MHGAGPILRNWLMGARARQRLLVATLMVAAGALLVALGDIRAGLIGVAGLLLLLAMSRSGLQSRRARQPVGATRKERS